MNEYLTVGIVLAATAVLSIFMIPVALEIAERWRGDWAGKD
jgi:hypothetical protein